MRKLAYFLFLIAFASCEADRDETTLKGTIKTACTNEPYSFQLIKVVTQSSKGFIFRTEEKEIVESEFYTQADGSFEHTFDPITSANQVYLYYNGKLIARDGYSEKINFSPIYQLTEFDIILNINPSEPYTKYDTLLVYFTDFSVKPDTIIGPFDSTYTLNKTISTEFWYQDDQNTPDYDVQLSYNWNLFDSTGYIKAKGGSIKVKDCMVFDNSFSF